MSSVLLPVALVAFSFVTMEAVTYAAHRWVMHGVGRRLHLSHHRPSSGRFEANDWYPVMFGTVVMIGLAVGFNVPGWGGLVWIGVGVTAYGLAYALVHDGYIHRRVGRWRRVHPHLERLADAHRLHHRYGGEPYGMLWPVVPAALQERAARDAQRMTSSSGSTPSHDPRLA